MMTDTTEQSVPKLVDFGLSNIGGPNDRMNEVLGTVAYASPEILQGKVYDKSVDVWSLGIIFFVLLSGTLPYQAATPKETMQLILKEPVLYLSPKWQQVDPRSKALVERML